VSRAQCTTLTRLTQRTRSAPSPTATATWRVSRRAPPGWDAAPRGGWPTCGTVSARDARAAAVSGDRPNRRAQPTLIVGPASPAGRRTVPPVDERVGRAARSRQPRRRSATCHPGHRAWMRSRSTAPSDGATCTHGLNDLDPPGRRREDSVLGARQSPSHSRNCSAGMGRAMSHPWAMSQPASASKS